MLQACTSLKLALPVQISFEQLPADLWARVLCFLEAKDLLRARLVSKEFVPLSNMLELDVHWGSLPEAKGSSLALFVNRYCTSPTSLCMHVNITNAVDNVGIRIPVWPRMMLAGSCSNLMHLTMPGSRLDLPAARTCLQLLPPTLECLGLDAPFKLIADPRLPKLQHLTCLQLSGHYTEPRVPPDCPAAGLLSLKALQVFVVWEEDRRGRLDGRSFSHPSLTKLELARNPFMTHLDLAQLPSLQVLSIFSYTHPIPAWLERQPFPRLELVSFQQLKGLESLVRGADLKLVMCNEVEISDAANDAAWAVADLLCMPCLTRIESLATWDGSVGSPVEIYGSFAEYHALLIKAELVLGHPLELKISDMHAVIPLRPNGHGVICVCSECRKGRK